jgi:SecD/SecF fusion protein
VSRAPLWRSLVAIAVLGASLYAALSIPARLGLDLRGGTQIVLEAQSTDRVKATAETTDRALEVLRRRVDALGVSEPTLARAGERRIVVELPGVQDPREAAEVIGKTAQLTFHPVTAAGVPGAPAEQQPRAPEGGQLLPDEDGVPLAVGPVALDGQALSGAQAVLDTDQGGIWTVGVDFEGGGQAWRQLTAKAACAPPGDPQRRVAIVLDGAVISSPQVDPSFACDVGMPGDAMQITGRFTATEAKDLAGLISGGALPVPVEVIEQRVVGPTLGADAIDASIRAAIIGLICTGIFIALVYRLVGVLATVALACYAMISYAVLVWLGATLTLPGLAGFVLAIGMAIDANVLVFERAREAYAAREDLPDALRTGFSKAWSAILDSNVTTLLAAGLLFFLASGPVRGFGVTLSIGVLASMVSALVIARVFTEWAVRRRFVQRRPRISGLAGKSRLRLWLERSGPDIMRRSTTWLVLAVGIIVLAVGGILARGLELGVEFTGGRLMEFSAAQPVDVDAARAAISDAGFPLANVQSSDVGLSDTDAGRNVSVRTEQLTNEEAVAVERALAGVAGDVTKERDELIGPSLGEELRNKALIALGVALGAQLLYLAIRFRWTWGLAAVLAMFHDVVAVVGLFAWLGYTIDGIFLAAALTIIGLSVNDTVVVFDRVRELVGDRPGQPFRGVVNDAVLQTIPRTVNTGLGAMFILAALAVLGGDSLQGFALALLAGLVVGTWSSVFTASPLLILLERRFPQEGTVRGMTAPARDAVPAVAATTRERGQRAPAGRARPGRRYDPADPYAFVDEAAPVSRRSD